MDGKEQSHRAQEGKSKTVPLTLESPCRRDQNMVTGHLPGPLELEPALRCELGLGTKASPYFQNQRLALRPHLKPSFKGKRDAGPENRQDVCRRELSKKSENLMTERERRRSREREFEGILCLL